MFGRRRVRGPVGNNIDDEFGFTGRVRRERSVWCRVVVHNGRDPGVAATVATLKSERPQMRVVHEPENTGCAGGWNRILAADPAAPWWLVVNDDIAFPPGALRNIASRVWAREQAEPDAGHYKFWYQHGASGWSCFALMARAVRRVGTFDENIFPVYFEDEDCAPPCLAAQTLSTAGR